MTTVSEIDPAPALVTLADLTPVHYRESFTLPITSTSSASPITSTSSAGPARTAEQWARLVLERAPRKARAQMLTVWTLLGIPLAPPWSRTQVLGWRILHNTPAAIVLESRAALGITARLVFHTSGTHLTQVMLVRYDHRPGRLVWSRLAPGHRRFIRSLLSRL